MNENIRVSDADRERVADRLRENYAEGRLSADEFDERLTAALGAKTFGDLRAVMADLPDGQPVAPAPQPPGTARWSGRPVMVHHHRHRVLPLLFLALIVAVAIPGAGLVFVTFLKVVLVFWLVACVAAMFAANKFRRRIRRLAQQQDFSGPWRQDWHHEWHR